MQFFSLTPGRGLVAIFTPMNSIFPQRSSPRAYLLVALGLWTAQVWATPSLQVPLDHWSYPFIERFEARGFVHGLGDGIKPFSHREMAQVLSAIAAAAQKGRELTRIERRELDLLLEEFGKASETPGDKGGKSPAPNSRVGRLRQGQPLFHYASEGGQLWTDLLLRQQTDVFLGRGRTAPERVFRNRLGGVVYGHFEDKFGFRIGFVQTREQGSRTYYRREDVYEKRLSSPRLEGDFAAYHEAGAYLVFSLPFLTVEFGKDEIAWGPAPTDNLGLSRNAPSYKMLRLQTRYGAFKLVSIAGFLQPCPEQPGPTLCADMQDSPSSYIVNHISSTPASQKYLAAHRLEWALAPWLDLGLQEIVIYGDRGLELTYLNPIMFYWAAQSYLGDTDNVMLGLDLDLHPGKDLRFYLALAADDLNYKLADYKRLWIFTDDLANKLSFQFGLLWIDPMGLSDTDLRAEYVRLEPWIYTHKFPINTFSHFDSPLGHSLGPNSDRWEVNLTHRFTSDLSTSMGLSQTRHGANELLPDGRSVRNVGGDLHWGRRAWDALETKQFLAGNAGEWVRLTGGVSLKMGRNMSLSARYVREWGRNVPLPPAWGPQVPLWRRTGYGDGQKQHFGFDFRYNYF